MTKASEALSPEPRWLAAPGTRVRAPLSAGMWAVDGFTG